MPMSFPTFDSLRNRAVSRNFRQPHPTECESDFRNALADFMRYVDSVESSEIRSGLGWDQQSPLSVLSGFGGRQEEALYLFEFEVPDVKSIPQTIVSGLGYTELNGIPVIQYDYYHGKSAEQQYNPYTDEPKEKVVIKTDIQMYICHPKTGIDRVQIIWCGGNAIALLKLSNVYSFDPTSDQTAVVAGFDEEGSTTKTSFKVKFHKELYVWSINHTATFQAAVFK